MATVFIAGNNNQQVAGCLNQYRITTVNNNEIRIVFFYSSGGGTASSINIDLIGDCIWFKQRNV
jgi:hypothetical protein